MASTHDILRGLWTGAGLPAELLEQASISLLNADQHVLRSSYRIGAAAQACIAATALAASLYRQLTTKGSSSSFEVQVDARHAALEFASEKFSRLRRTDQAKDDAVPTSHANFKRMIGLPADTLVEWDPLAGYYLCAQGRYIRLHTNWKHHKLGLLKILDLHEDATRDEVAACLLKWDAERLEDEARRAGMCATMCRSAEEWKATEAGQSVQAWLDENHGCPVKVVKVSLPSTALSTSDLPAAKAHCPLRVVDMSRVIAAPVAGRALANHGADVLLIACLRLPNLPMLEIDTARGKRAAAIDLDDDEGMAIIKKLIRDADVLLQSYRPDALARRGLSLKNLQQLRSGLIYAELNAYGFTGPWKDVRGFDSLVQSASGINTSEAESYNKHVGEDNVGPRVLPVQALDHATGYLLAFGIIAAKCRSILEGEQIYGWHVQVSLAGTAAWLESLGRVEGAQAWRDPVPIDAESKEVQDLLEEYIVRGAKDPTTLHSIKHAASPLPSSHKAVPIRIGLDPPSWDFTS